ncbi:hypothetical protein U9M48_024844 [Paspalum notatum var. saurae]|uniref:Reverse transcriptase n=1 Tax=Paspalum notatum var. saurae TaxID=547442 RepID=A0AAQ3WXE2_PASNO
MELEDDANEEDAAANLGISLHALIGIATANTMRLRVRVGDAELLALVDLGSTHTFINTATAQRLVLPIQPRPGLSVKDANGDSVTSLGLCPDMALHIQDDAFYINCYALALDGFDIVLGVQWLASLGPIMWDFAALSMEFWRNGRVVHWRGEGSGAPTLLSVGPATDLMEALLADYNVFAVPTTLPPVRSHDHRIHLLPRAAPVAVRPYRYPQLLKDEIERQCEDMLTQGIIRPTSSPFSSPVLLVKKHDGSWHFCVDYRALNDKTINDKFPILMVDELLDELKGASFFTKLDLRSGYHQVRMHPDDVAKTAFRTHHGHFEFLVMPFVLTNAPATFQALMNDILRPYIRRFVLVFFDDIWIYSSSWAEHLQHVKAVLQLLRRHELFLKRSKCFFGQETVVYLGHIISGNGVAMDPDKVAAVEAWPRPRTVRALRGFLGLTGYYRKFIAGYGSAAHPLTALLKREAFSWAPEADHAFMAIKRALMSAPLLQLPDFSACFLVDCDASGFGFGAVLHQGDGAIAFFSRPVAPHHAKLPAYERELIGLVKAVHHWRPYLWGRPFTVHTDHWSLKFLLDQRLTMIPQHTWYRPGKQNVVADALSHRDVESSLAVHALTVPPFDIFSALWEELVTNPQAQDIRWTDVDGLLLFKGRALVPDESVLWPQLLEAAHAIGHEGAEKSLHPFRASFYNSSAHHLIREFFRGCLVCQRNKTEHLHPAGLLQPLPVPSEVWSDIAMDFVEGFPKVGGKSVVLTVVDRFSKYGHFIPLGHPYSAASVARVFFDSIVRLHVFPCFIVSDRDPVFTSTFWAELLRLSGVKLLLSSAFHPQTDGQSEVTNRTIVMYLRCLAGDRPRSWLQWLPWAEYCFNTSYQSSLRTTPFQVVYGREPPNLLKYQLGTARVAAVDRQLQDRDLFLAEIHERLLLARDTMKLQSDKKQRDLSFQVGDWVWLRLHHRTATAITTAASSKLGPRFYGPYEVIERIGEVAYRLRLPVGAKIHDVFHVALLKAFNGTPPSSMVPLPPILHGRVLPQPHAVLRARLSRGVWEVLVQWLGRPASDATWEPLESFTSTYPEVQLAEAPEAQKWLGCQFVIRLTLERFRD